MTFNTKNFPARLYKMTQAFCREVPSTIESRSFIDLLVATLFPIRDKKPLSLKETELRWEVLQEHLLKIIYPLCKKDENGCNCHDIVDNFFNEIPLIYTRLLKDAEIYRSNDPASDSAEEVILCYPGFYSVMIYRFANVLYKLDVPVFPRIISEYAHSQTGIDIHPGATIGSNLYIDHGTGIVIGETTIIGNRVKIYQGVTLGAIFVNKTLSGVRRHPKIEDDVIIYAGSTILGGETTIGKNTIIGGNVWLTASVPRDSRVYHTPEIIIKGSNKKYE